jgi:glycosyltransferase involved in cell wall biosynthesis
MRICLNLLAASAGGHLTRARAFLDRFPEYAGDIELIVLKEKGVLTEYKTVAGREVVNVRIGLGELKSIRRGIWENTKMFALLHDKKIDVYLTFSSYLPKIFPRALPSVVSVSNLAPFSDRAREAESSFLIRLKMTLLKHNILASAQRADQMIALSETCKDVLIGHGIEPAKISVIPNGIEEFWFHQMSCDSGVLHDHGIVRPYLLYVSNFYHYKNHHRLLNAFAMLPLSIRTMYQLVLVGKPLNKTYYDEVLALRSHLALNDVIVIAGEEGERLRQIYQQATLFVFPSLIENCPNILLEAMAAGLPVLASCLAPMPEFCGEAAEYFDPLDVSDMALKILMLLDNKARLADMKVSAVRKAKLFSWNRFVNDVVQQCLIAGRA